MHQVWDDRRECSGGCEVPNRHDWSHTFTDTMWRAYADFWYHPRPILNAASSFSTSNWSNEAGYADPTVTEPHSVSFAWSGAQFLTNCHRKACWTSKLATLHRASLTNEHIEIGLGRRHGDSNCVAGGIGRKICTFDDVSHVEAICVQI